MRTRGYTPDKAEVERRKSIQRFGDFDTPKPAFSEALPFKLGETVDVESPLPVSEAYRVPVMMPTSNRVYTTVRIFNLPISFTRREFETFLARITKVPISTLTFVMDREKRAFRGFAFCSFIDTETANTFVKDVDGRVIDSHKVGAVLVRK